MQKFNLWLLYVTPLYSYPHSSMSVLHSSGVLLSLTTLKLFISLPLLKSYIPSLDLIWSCALLACWEWAQLAKGDKWACAYAFTHSHYSFIFSIFLLSVSSRFFHTYKTEKPHCHGWTLCRLHSVCSVPPVWKNMVRLGCSRYKLMTSWLIH